MSRPLRAALALIVLTACGAPSGDVRATLVLEGVSAGEHRAIATFEDDGTQFSVDTEDGDSVVANVTVWFNSVPTAGTYHCADLFNASWGVATADGNWDSSCKPGYNLGDVEVVLHEVTAQGGGYVMHGTARGIAKPMLDETGDITVNAVF